MPLDDASYLVRFDERNLGPEHFDHVGHLRMAWIHLAHYGEKEATRRVCEGIRDLAAGFGAPEKFHYTLTAALMHIMARRMRETRYDSFDDFLSHNCDLVDDARAVVARHYSESRLARTEARHGWIEPDREPIE